MTKKRINSRAKGSYGEREFRDFLRSYGIQARRGQQFSGSGESPDVVHDLDGWHAEVKRTECLSLYTAMDQATRDASSKNLIPFVAHRRNKKPWLVILPADQWVQLVLLQRELARTLGLDLNALSSAALLEATKRFLSTRTEPNAAPPATTPSLPSPQRNGQTDAAKPASDPLSATDVAQAVKDHSPQ